MIRREILPQLNPRQMRIYKKLVASGQEGSSREELIKEMMNGEKKTPGAWTMLRVNIHGMNRTLAPLEQRIVRNYRAGYMLRHALS